MPQTVSLYRSLTLAQNCTKLSTFCLHACGQLTNDSIKAIGDNLELDVTSLLEELDVTSLHFMTTEVLKAAVDKLPILRVLYVEEYR